MYKLIKDNGGSTVFVMLIASFCLMMIIFTILIIFRQSNLHKISPTTDNTNTTSSPGIYYLPGKTTFVKSILIGPSGGTLKVDNTGTPVDGVLVEVHAGALSKEITLSIGYNNGQLKGPGATDGAYSRSAGKTLVLATSPDSDMDFNVAFNGKAVQITVPYDRLNNPIVMPYAINDNDLLKPLQIETQDEATSTVRFSTFHPVMFTWFYIYSH